MGGDPQVLARHGARQDQPGQSRGGPGGVAADTAMAQIHCRSLGVWSSATDGTCRTVAHGGAFGGTKCNVALRYAIRLWALLRGVLGQGIAFRSEVGKVVRPPTRFDLLPVG